MKTYRVATVDLSTGQCSERCFDESLTRAYLGGGLGAYVLCQETTADIEPLADESVVCVLNGLLTGTGVPGGPKLSFRARSPLTGIWGESTVGGHWPTHLRHTGFDGLIIRGRSDSPVVIRLEEDGAHLDDAGSLWGMDTFDASDQLAQQYPDYAMACIGPAGERCLPISSVIVDGRIARAAGRGGLGAVLGSKMVKAVVAFGKKNYGIHDSKGLKALLKNDIKSVKENAARLKDYGTSGYVEAAEESGDLPIKNWKEGSWAAGAKKITAQTFFPKYLEKHHTCYACPLRCGKILKQEEGPYAGSVSHAPEYETLGGFGGCCLVDSAEAIMDANEYCNRTGIDTMSASSVIAFAMEAYERGVITTEDTGGKEILWGNREVVLGLLHDMVEGRGIGRLLASGVRHAAEVLGHGSDEYAVHVKGLEVAMHDPRAYTSMAASYAVANRGGDHLEGMSYLYERGLRIPGYGYQGDLEPGSNENKSELAHANMSYYALFNPLGLCKFISIGQTSPQMIVGWINKVTGWDMTVEELLECGERLTNIKRMYNLQRGVTGKDDTLPPRLLQPRPDGAAKGVVPDVAGMVCDIYQMRGWDEQGVPEPKTLERLDLTWVSAAVESP
jgi:aldehyde:ferredoxin oxidoreductase